MKEIQQGGKAKMCSSVLLRTEESNLSYTSQPIYMDSSILGVKNKRGKHKSAKYKNITVHMMKRVSMGLKKEHNVNRSHQGAAQTDTKVFVSIDSNKAIKQLTDTSSSDLYLIITQYFPVTEAWIIKKNFLMYTPLTESWIFS